MADRIIVNPDAFKTSGITEEKKIYGGGAGYTEKMALSA
jgi:hypothetical protein